MNSISWKCNYNKSYDNTETYTVLVCWQNQSSIIGGKLWCYYIKYDRNTDTTTVKVGVFKDIHMVWLILDTSDVTEIFPNEKLRTNYIINYITIKYVYVRRWVVFNTAYRYTIVSIYYCFLHINYNRTDKQYKLKIEWNTVIVATIIVLTNL